MLDEAVTVDLSKLLNFVSAGGGPKDKKNVSKIKKTVKEIISKTKSHKIQGDSDNDSNESDDEDKSLSGSESDDIESVDTSSSVDDEFADKSDDEDEQKVDKNADEDGEEDIIDVNENEDDDDEEEDENNKSKLLLDEAEKDDILECYEEEEEEDINVEPLQVSNSERISQPKLTKYEKVRILSTRTKQLAMGAPPFVKNVYTKSPLEIAEIELSLNMIPLKIKRPMPNNTYEIWSLNELEK